MSVPPFTRWLLALCLSLAACNGEPPVAPQAEAPPPAGPAPVAEAPVIAEAPRPTQPTFNFGPKPEAEPEPASEPVPEPEPAETPKVEPATPEMRAVNVPGAGGDLADDHARMLGKWVTKDGEAILHEFTSTVMTIHYPFGKQSVRYTIDATKSPKHFNLIVQENGQRIEVPGLYEFRGDDLILCIPEPRESEEGSPRALPERPTAIARSQGFIHDLARMSDKPAVEPLVTLGRKMPWRGDNAMAFSSDNRLMAVSLGGGIFFWDLETNTKAGRIEEPHDHSIEHLEFSHDGKRLISVTDWSDAPAKVWDVATRECVLTIEDVDEVASFSPDGQFIAVGGRWNSPRLHDATTGELKFTLSLSEESCWDLSFSPDGKSLATVTPKSDAVYIWNVVTGEEVTRLQGAGDKRKVRFLPDGKRLAVCASRGNIEIWNISDKEIVATIPTPYGIYAMAVSPNGQLLAGAPLNRHPAVWQIEADRARILPNILPFFTMGRDQSADSVGFSPDGRFLGVASDNMFRVWPLPGAGELSESTVFPPPLTADEEKAFRHFEWFQTVRSAMSNLPLSFGGLPENIKLNDQPAFSWRVRLLDPLGRPDILRRLSLDKPRDHPDNAQALAEGDQLYAENEGLDGKTRVLMVTGPDTNSDPETRARFSESGSRPIITLVQAAPESAVPWAEPRDFVFDPANPWSGLPKEGFWASIMDTGLRFIPGDTSPETLKALFTGISDEPLDLDEVTVDPYRKYIFGPDS